MFAIATELAQHDPIYEPMAVKYFEHFLNMAHAMSNMSGEGINLWDEEDQFFYDVIHLVHALREFHAYYGDSFTVECPTGSGRMLTLDVAARELAGRLINISSVHKDWLMLGNTAYCLQRGDADAHPDRRGRTCPLQHPGRRCRSGGHCHANQYRHVA
jgi:hypothetical protein